MADAAAAPWDSGPVYRPPDARAEWEEPVHRPARALRVVRRKALRIDAVRAEEVLEDVSVAQARRALALRRRLNRATAQATHAVEQRQRLAAGRAERVMPAERALLEQQRDAAMAELHAVRVAVEERLRRHAEAAEAERLAAEEQARVEEAMAAQARHEAERAERAERERQAAREAARLEAQRMEHERVAALERARAEELEREAAWVEAMAEEARQADGRRRLALANKLERQAAWLRDYEAWAESRGLRGTQAAGLSAEADRLGRRVDELRYG